MAGFKGFVDWNRPDRGWRSESDLKLIQRPAALFSCVSDHISRDHDPTLVHYQKKVPAIGLGSSRIRGIVHLGIVHFDLKVLPRVHNWGHLEKESSLRVYILHLKQSYSLLSVGNGSGETFRPLMVLVVVLASAFVHLRK